MLTDHDALFAAILARPADDLARLVFADFLEESGHPARVARAAYIRTQIAATAETDPAEQLRLTRVAAELRGQFRDEADPLLDAAPGLMAFRRRGFVDELRAPLAVLRAHAAGLFQVAPVTALHFEDFATDAEWMHSALYLRGVRRLKVGPSAWAGVYPYADTARLEALLQCRHLRNVETLDLARNNLNNRWVEWFIPRLPGTLLGQSLRRLDLSGNHLIAAAASLLSSARGLDGLDLLDLTGNSISPVAEAALRARFGDRVRV